MLTEVYHTTSLFPPSTQASRDQFDARISIIGRRLERRIHGRLWYLCSSPDDMDDAMQTALIRLWQLYQRRPWMMDLGDNWWIKVGQRAAQNALRGMIAQHGMKTAKGVRRFEFNASSLQQEDDLDFDGLELAEMKRFRHTQRSLRPESEQVDRHIDTDRLVEEALKRLTIPQQEALRLLIPLIAQGYLLKEAARQTGLDRGRAQYAWESFRQQCEQITGHARQPLKGKGTPATADELAQIRELAAHGLSCTVIAQQIGRNKNFVKVHFARATGYRRGSTYQRNPITPQHVEQMKHLRSRGFSIASIAKNVGCSSGSVCHWLRQ